MASKLAHTARELRSRVRAEAVCSARGRLGHWLPVASLGTRSSAASSHPLLALTGRRGSPTRAAAPAAPHLPLEHSRQSFSAASRSHSPGNRRAAPWRSPPLPQKPAAGTASSVSASAQPPPRPPASAPLSAEKGGPSAPKAAGGQQAAGSGGPHVPNLKRFRIYRWNPDRGGRPVLQEFAVDTTQCGPMLLDALFQIKGQQDATLTFRRSCREGICGSCSMNVDGENVLACLHPIDVSHPERVTTVAPLPHMFVVKDLVVDLTWQYQQYKSIEPWLKTRSPPPRGRERLQSPAERSRLDGRYECILCFCCSAACPSYWWSAEAFLGPAALIHASRWVFDSRDEFKRERLSALEERRRMFACHTIMNCAKTCPKHLNPGKAIAQMRRMTITKELTARPDTMPLIDPVSANMRQRGAPWAGQ